MILLAPKRANRKYRNVLIEKPREIAARILLRHGSSRDYAENLLDAELERSGLVGPDRGLLQELVYGVLRPPCKSSCAWGFTRCSAWTASRTTPP